MKKESKLLQEFREFAVRGNVVDMAIGIVIGAAFATVVNSFVNDILMPPINMLTGGVDYSGMVIVLRPATATVEAITINYGSFITAIINFTIISAAIFLVVKQMNRVKKEEDKKEKKGEKEPAQDIKLLTEIRDLLKK